MTPFEEGHWTFRPPVMTPELAFAGWFLEDRGYVFPADFTPDNAVDKAAWELLNYLETCDPTPIPKRLR